MDSLIWKKFLKKIITEGYPHTKDDSPIYEHLGNHIWVKHPHHIPFVNQTNDINIFLDKLKNGFYDIDDYPIQGLALYEYVTAWDKKDMINCDNFIYTYPERVFNYNGISQYKIMKNRLLNNDGSNRAVAVLYDPSKDAEIEDIPCLNWLQATIRDDDLVLHCMFRSNDIYGAWPSNMLLLTYLGLKLANDCGVNFYGIDYHSTSAHIYKTDMEAAMKATRGI